MAKDRKMWAALKLNDELFTFIATKMHVPFQINFQLSCVCKTWNAFLADRHVHRYFSQQLSQTPRYIVSAYHPRYAFAACDIEMKCWHKWPIAIHLKYFSLYDLCGDAGDWLLVTRSSVDVPFEGLCLANPTKRSFRKLPSFPNQEGRDWIPYAMGVALGESSKSCKVFVVDQLDFYSHKVYLYNFELDSWKAFGAWQRNDGETICNMTLYEGTLHSIINTRTVDRTRRIMNVCRLDERKSRWQELPAQISENLNVYFSHLFQWRGNLMLIEAREGGQHDNCRLASFHIWQLDKKDHVWVESTRMPDHIVDHLHVTEIDVISFFLLFATWNDQICITSRTVIRQDTTSISKRRHVLCDLSKPLWWDVAEPPFFYFQYDGFSVLIPKLEFETL